MWGRAPPLYTSSSVWQKETYADDQPFRPTTNYRVWKPRSAPIAADASGRQGARRRQLRQRRSQAYQSVQWDYHGPDFASTTASLPFDGAQTARELRDPTRNVSPEREKLREDSSLVMDWRPRTVRSAQQSVRERRRALRMQETRPQHLQKYSVAVREEPGPPRIQPSAFSRTTLLVCVETPETPQDSLPWHMTAPLPQTQHLALPPSYDRVERGSITKQGSIKEPAYRRMPSEDAALPLQPRPPQAVSKSSSASLNLPELSNFNIFLKPTRAKRQMSPTRKDAPDQEDGG